MGGLLVSLLLHEVCKAEGLNSQLPESATHVLHVWLHVPRCLLAPSRQLMGCHTTVESAVSGPAVVWAQHWLKLHYSAWIWVLSGYRPEFG